MIITIKIVIKFLFIFKSLNLFLTYMSLSTSKSKTQLAYARSTKAVNKPKTKNSSTIQPGDNTKNRHGPRNSTGNIYDSIMGQIQPKQQDYIKSLIVKNQKEVSRQEKQMMGDKQGENAISNNKNDSKKTVKNSSIVNGNTIGVLKVTKQAQVSSRTQLSGAVHERTRSQAQLMLKEPSIITSNIETTKSIVQSPSQKQVTEISCNDSQVQVFEDISSGKDSRVKLAKTSNSKEMLFRLSQSAMGECTLEKVDNTKVNNRKDSNSSINNAKNPIIQALNNTSSSFAKKLQAFELQYPNEQRQQRSTHKKVPSKLSVEYFSCQTSPKNNSKNIYTKEMVVTTKPNNNYTTLNRNQPISANISPISSTKNSNQKSHKKQLQVSQPTIGTNFISCLDEYLQALTFNNTVSQTVQENGRQSSRNICMKRSNSSKFKEFSTSKGHPFTLGQQQEEEETILLGNGPFKTNKTSKTKLQANPNSGKLLSYPQQQKMLKQLSQQRKKVSQLNSIMEMFHQQLAKYKKKEKKMKENQYHMIEVMKQLNEQLTQERNQRRRLEGVVSEFESKIRGISRGKEKMRRDSLQDQQRPQRKTIYGPSSMGNSINFNHHQKNISKLQKHSKKPSFNRLSSMINSVNYNNSHQDNQNNYDPYLNEQKHSLEEGFFKNKTQKFSKIISNFQLQNQPCDEDDQMYFRSKNFPNVNGRVSNNERKVMRDSLKNPGYHNGQPTSCKNSYMNSSMPINNGKTKSRPMTPKLVEELFRSTNMSKNIEYQTKNYSSSEQSCHDTSRQYTKEQHFDEDGNVGNEGFEESGSEFRQTEMSDDEYVGEEQEYYHEVIKRMR